MVLPSGRRGSLAPALGLGGLIAFLAWNALWFSPFVVDDAFISMRYARNLVAGEGLVFNAGERVEGFSNFLWVLIEAGLVALGAPVVLGVQVLGLLAGAAAVVLTFGLARQVAPPAQAGPVAWLAAAFLAANTSLALWSVAGLETSLLAALLVASVWCFERELGGGRRRPASALLFALAWATRPEAPAYGLYFALRRLSGRRAAPLGRADLHWVLVLAALVVPYEVFGLVYYGHLVPATQAAKVGGGWPFTGAGLVEFVGGQGAPTAALLAAGGLGCALGWRRWPPAAWVPLGCGLLFVAYAGRDWMPRFRFFVPCLPFLGLSLACGLAAWRERLPGRAGRAAWVAAVAALGLGYVHDQATGAYRRGDRGTSEAGSARGFWPAEVPGRLGTRSWPQEPSTWWILQNIPAGETVALADIGFPGFLTANPIWDLRGLVTPAVAAWRHDPSEAAGRAMLEALRAARPACILIPSLGRNPEKLMGRLEGELASAPWIRAGWRRGEIAAAHAILYVRRDLAPLDRRAVRARVRDALARLPEYDSDLVREARTSLSR